MALHNRLVKRAYRGRLRNLLQALKHRTARIAQIDSEHLDLDLLDAGTRTALTTFRTRLDFLIARPAQMRAN